MGGDGNFWLVGSDGKPGVKMVIKNMMISDGSEWVFFCFGKVQMPIF